MGKIEVSAEDVKGMGPVLLAGTWVRTICQRCTNVATAGGSRHSIRCPGPDSSKRRENVPKNLRRH